MRKSICIVCLLAIGMATGQSQQVKREKKGLKGWLGVNVETTHDKFENSTTYRMTGNKVKINGAVASGLVKGAVSFFSKNRDMVMNVITVRLQLENHIVHDSISQLSVILKVSIEDDGAFRVMNGESLVFLVDGERIGLSTDGAFNQDDFVIDGDAMTHARYLVTQDQIEHIINAETVEFRIMQQGLTHGQAQARDKLDNNFEGTFSKKNFKAWQEFYQTYILPHVRKS